MLFPYMAKFYLLISFMLLFSPFEATASTILTPQWENVTQQGEVKRGQGLYQALRAVQIDNALALEIINALSDEVEFSKLKVGDKLEATFNQHKELVKFSFSQNPAEKHIVKKIEGKWQYEFLEEKTFWNARILEGELRANSTLQSDLLAHGLSPSVVNEIVNVLLLRVNFRMNARVGDVFKVLLHERMFQGTTIQTKVLYTSYQGVRAGKHEAFFYEDAQKSSTYTAHYTEDGQALISSGLRYPLASLHVRSGYGWRRHPVTGQRAMHRGVDLRGRRGTPVHAVADGRVVNSNYNQFAGNQIAIRHRDGSQSYYLHLDRRSVKKGDWVRTYQVIGTVGATGRVTGPHLHFGFKTPQGKWMNPLNKRMIATPKLQGERLASLKEQISSIRGLMIDLEIIKDAKYLLAQIPNQREESIFEWDVLQFDDENQRVSLMAL
ncbi:MAG TPA: peptidoglycan DD-metalloendopeptidase family protein [Bacteriovoracaceae bacterium]|nr:peptidoglycan DD-metalloendopeptidase family protein [Bacteriovoracaceae bacterium]